MRKKPDGTLVWNVKEVARALRITIEDVQEYFTDGRRISFILERRIAREVLKATRPPSEGAGFDIIDSHGGKWEVRSISREGIYFSPSYMVGSGRHFNESGFLNKLSEIRGYIIADIESFPNVPFWVILSEQVRKWWSDRKLGTTTKVSRKKALKLLDELGEVKT